jgi:hypothetical protein
VQNFISFVDDQLYLEEIIPHRHDCHDPPHAVRVGDHGDESPPRRLAGVERSGLWKATPAQVGFPGEAMRRRRLLWVVGSNHWCRNCGEEYLWRNWRGEDCYPEQEIHTLGALSVPKVELEGFTFTRWPKRYFMTHGVSCVGGIEFIVIGPGSTYSGMPTGPACDGISKNRKSPWCEEYALRQAGSKLGQSPIMRARRGTRRMIVPPTPHGTGSSARSLLRRRFQSFARPTAPKKFAPAHLWARSQPSIRRTPSWSLPGPARDLLELSLIPVLNDDCEQQKKLPMAPPSLVTAAERHNEADDKPEKRLRTFCPG